MKQSFFIHLRSFILIALILSVTGCNNTQTNSPSIQATAAASVTPIPSLTSTTAPSLTPNPTATPTSTKPVWEIMENWTPANQIRAMLIDQSGDLWTGGPAGVVHWDLKTNTPTSHLTL